MKRVLMATTITLASVLFSSISNAGPVYHPVGSNLVYGDVSNSYSILSGIENPAAGAAEYKPGEGGVDIGLFSSFGIGAEIGDVNNIYDQIDQQAAKFNQTINNSFSSQLGSNGAAGIASTITSTINDTNSLLDLIDKKGYAKVFSTLEWPLMPIKVSGAGLGGSWKFNANSSFEARLGLLSDTINLIDTSSGPNGLQQQIQDALDGKITSAKNGDLSFSYDGTNVNFTVNNDSTAIIKASLIHELSLAYSRKIWNNNDSNLFAGITGKYYRVQLLQEYTRIAQNGNSQSLFDNASISDSATNSGFGLDFGALWVASNFHLGATITNINEPSFDYKPAPLTGYTDTTTINKLQSSDTYKMKRQLKIEGALYTQDKHWIIGGELDTNPVEDPMGDKYQWTVISAAYLSDHWWLPAVRFGYRANNAGTKLSYLTGGVTIFKSLNLDLAYSPSKVEVNNSSTTRSFMINIGLDVSF